MMRKRPVLAITCVFLVTATVFSQSFTVDYLDGTVELKTSKTWKALSIGEKLTPDAVIRISGGGSIELAAAKSRITIIKDGTYTLADLARASEKKGGTGVGSAIAQKLHTLTTERRESSAVGVAGVRGAEQGAGASVMWVEEGEETRRQADEMIAQRKYKEAVEMLEEAVTEASTGPEQDEMTYLLSAAYYGDGQTVKAFRALAKINPQPDAVYYPRYLMLKAQILEDSLAFQEAVNLLKPFIAANPTGEPTQMALLLSAYAYRGLGDEKSARDSLDAGLKLGAETETGKLIAQALNP